jgi:hypothetical protein
MVNEGQPGLGSHLANELMVDAAKMCGNLEIRRHLEQTRTDEFAEQQTVATHGRQIIEIYPSAQPRCESALK